jgi:DNA-binding GntR family transcriptional regulator
MPLKPLQDATLGDRAYDSIKEAILSLQVRPGELLGIGDLADQLGVSRTPVRDALIRLESDGLVEIVARKGALVTHMREEDVREIYELRVLLESYAARLATPLLSSVDVKRLELNLAQAEQALGSGDDLAAAELGRTVHNALIEKVRNGRFQTWLESLEVQYTRSRRFVALIPHRAWKSHQEHAAIVRAVAAGDAEGAAEAMRNHLVSVQDDLLANISSLPDHLGSRVAAQLQVPSDAAEVWASGGH